MLSLLQYSPLSLLILVELCHNMGTRLRGYKDKRIQGCNVTYFDAELCLTCVPSYLGSLVQSTSMNENNLIIIIIIFNGTSTRLL